MTISSLKYIVASLFVAAAVMFGCDSGGGNGAQEPAPTGGPEVPIRFAAGTEGLTRAITDFPNTTIGVSATYEGYADDWRNYGKIMNDKATIAADSAGAFWFRWETVKYWPFDGTGLIFAAYSPHTSASPALSLNYDLRHLDINLADDVPDVLYASDNAVKAFTKADTVANLGEFRHALSELTIIVTADDQVNPAVTIAGLEVSTTKGKATLDLLTDGDLDFGGGRNFTYGMVTSETRFTQRDPYSGTVYLFPGTEDDTKITITLNDSSYTFDATYNLTDIMFDNDPNAPLTLVRGANTTVTITVSGTPVQNPDDVITLQGLMTGWIDKGQVEVTIN